MNTVPEAIVADVDPKDGAYLRMCYHYGVIPEPFPHKAIAFAALQGEREDKHAGGWDARERALCLAHLRRRPPAPLRALRPRAPRPDAPIGEPLKLTPEPLRGPDFCADLHARRDAGEDLSSADLAEAIGMSVTAAHRRYLVWCEERGVAPQQGSRGRGSWAPWIADRYLAGYEPAEIAAAIARVTSNPYTEAQVNRLLVCLRVAKDPLHKALRAKP
jgi:hypothetical protein